MRAHTGLLFLAIASARAGAQEVALATLAGKTLPLAADTMIRCIQRGTDAPGGCGNPYIRIVESPGRGAYELRNEYFDSTGKRTTVQITRVTPALAVRYQRVQDTRDSAALVVVDGMASGWVAAPSGTKLIGVANAPERYEPDLVEQAFALSRPAIGQFVAFPIGSLYAPQGIGVTMDTLRVSERSELVAGNRRIAALVLTHRNGNLTWVDASGRVLARRGSAGPGAFWWHVARGVELPKASGSAAKP